METKTGRLYLEIQTSRKNPVGILRTSYYEKGKTKHSQHGRIKGCTFNQLKMLQIAFREKVLPVDHIDAFKILQSKEYGASYSVLEIIKQIGLDKIIYSKSEPWVKNIMAMITGRIVYAGSKLSLCNQANNTMLCNLCGVEKNVDVEKHCYLPMDKLLSRQNKIQKQLANKHLKNGHLVLYDITSSYLEGQYEASELVKYGYNRDRKNGHEQIVIGLLCNSDGCPVGVEVYPGNTKDESTVVEKIKEVKKNYNIEKIVFVGDRGMVTKSNKEKLEDEKDLHTISALTRAEIFDLLDRNVIQTELFDERKIHESVDPDNPNIRYCLCRNPLSAERDKNTRNRLLELTKQSLEKITNYKKKTTPEILGSRIGKVLAKYKMGKFIEWEIKANKKNKISNNHQVIWSLDEKKIEAAKPLDGCYIITTDVKAEDLEKNKVVDSYKKLELVEQAFRNLKTVQLEMRPIYHKKDDRIRTHVFLCMLSYYVQWHMQQLLKPLFDSDGKGKKRRWTFANVIETLKQITYNKTISNGAEFFQISQPTLEQSKILKNLGIKI